MLDKMQLNGELPLTATEHFTLYDAELERQIQTAARPLLSELSAKLNAIFEAVDWNQPVPERLEIPITVGPPIHRVTFTAHIEPGLLKNPSHANDGSGH